MSKKILLTGASGFIGSSVMSTLSSQYIVKAGFRSLKKTELVDGYFEIGEINGLTQWGDSMIGVDTVIHLAAIAHNNSNDLNYINNVNVKGSINLAQQAFENGVKRFIFISSIGVLGHSTNCRNAFNEQCLPSPHSLYASSKLKAEIALLQLARDTGLDVVIIRPVLVYGKGAPGNFNKLLNLIRKIPILPFAFCKNKRSFIAVDNLVDFISVCIEHPKAANEVFCISDGVDVSIREFTDAIATGLNKNLIQLPVPMFLFKLIGKLTGKGELIEQLIGDLQVDSSKAKHLLGWKPPVTMAETFLKFKSIK